MPKPKPLLGQKQAWRSASDLDDHAQAANPLRERLQPAGIERRQLGGLRLMRRARQTVQQHGCNRDLETARLSDEVQVGLLLQRRGRLAIAQKETALDEGATGTRAALQAR